MKRIAIKILMLAFLLAACSDQKDQLDAGGYYNRGVAHAEAGRHHKAIEAYHQAIQLKPDHADTLYNLVQVYLKIEDKESALKEYERLKVLDPKGAKQFFDLK